MDFKSILIVGCLLASVDLLNANRKRHRHTEGKGGRSQGSMVQIEDNDDKGLIDLDDMVTFDVALEHFPEGQVEKHREDTREIRIDGGFGPAIDRTKDVNYINEGENIENVSPLSIVSGIQETSDEFQVNGGEVFEEQNGDAFQESFGEIEQTGEGFEQNTEIVQNGGEMQQNGGGYILNGGKMQQTGGVSEHYEMITGNFTDDEDLTSGSGSGDVIIEDATGEYENALNTNDSFVADAEVSTHSDFPPYCEERLSATWAPWSTWIQSGDQDIRFRRCRDANKFKTSSDNCPGQFMETRYCSISEERTCRQTNGDMTTEHKTQCDGLNLNDIESIDDIRNPLDAEDDCEYTLFDVKYRLAIGNPLSTFGLNQADHKLWCTARDKYIPFYSPHQRCQRNLEKFCKEAKECKYDTTDNEERTKAFQRQTCWKEHVLGGVLPAGIPVYQSQQMICQRFDKDSKLGKSLGQKDSYFATLFDTKKRLPAVSMVTVRALGDEKWPNVPFMIERALVEDDSSSVVSWFFKMKKKGMTSPREMTSQCEIPTCTYGKKQALPSDYEFSSYKIMPLLPPDLVGWDIGKKISTLTMTNAVPIEPTLYSAWRKAHVMVRKFAVETCRIPMETTSQDQQTHRQDGHDLPELYLLSGTVAPSNHYEVIGNDVTVPQIIWLSACCAHGAEVASFGVYMYNNFGETPAVVSLEQLYELLQSTYYESVEEIKIDLYPAFDNACSAAANDISYQMKMP